MTYEVKITAVGEVRDADGNLIEQVPVEGVERLTHAELVERGMVPPEAGE